MPTATETSASHTTSALDHVRPLHEMPGFDDRCREFGEDVVEIVRFISELEEGITQEVQDELAAKDSVAEASAMRTGKLKLYKKGDRDEEGIADNECWWIDEEAASSVIHDPDHIQSTQFMIDNKIYKDFRIEIYKRTPGTDTRTTLVRVMTKAMLEAHVGH